MPPELPHGQHGPRNLSCCLPRSHVPHAADPGSLSSFLSLLTLDTPLSALLSLFHSHAQTHVTSVGSAPTVTWPWPSPHSFV